MISTLRLDPFSSRVIFKDVLTQFVISNIADSDTSPEFHIFQEAPGRLRPCCLNASPYRSLDDALQAASRLTLF